MSSYDAKYIEDLKSRYNNLSRLKIQTETELSAAQKDLDNAMSEAEKEFGVKTLDELRELYSKKENENSEKVANFEKTISDIEAKLREL